jgi:hypothetical protein
MTIWLTAALRMALALVASIISIRTAVSAAVVKLLVGVVGSAVIPTMIAQAYFRPHIPIPAAVPEAHTASPAGHTAPSHESSVLVVK